MKLKRLREDFVVREVNDFPLTGGSFAVYRLEKSGIVHQKPSPRILKVWNLSRRAVGYGGLKDRHAETSQTITLFKGPQRDLEQRGFLLTYLGQANRAFEAKDILSNCFEVTLRDLTAEALERAEGLLPAVASGVPNYFDDQRFVRSARAASSLPSRGAWAITSERFTWLSPKLTRTIVRAKKSRRKSATVMGNWLECKAKLDRSHRRSIVTYLVDHPTDFKGARWLCCAATCAASTWLAFQSHLWNEIVSRCCKLICQLKHWYTRRGAAGELTFWSSTSGEILAQFEV